MHVNETYYLAVPSGENTNFYRISVDADTYLGKARYRSGWFPADAVDGLSGKDVIGDGAKALKTEQAIRDQLNSAITQTTNGYLDAASKPETSEEVIQGWLNAQRRVRAIAGDGVMLPDGAIEIEYDPAASLALRHAGQKLVFVLSNDPDKVIERIQTIAAHNDTGATILRLADVIHQRAKNDVDEAKAKNDIASQVNEVIVTYLERMSAPLDGDKDKQTLLSEVETLLVLIDNVK